MRPTTVERATRPTGYRSSEGKSLRSGTRSSRLRSPAFTTIPEQEYGRVDERDRKLTPAPFARVRDLPRRPYRREPHPADAAVTIGQTFTPDVSFTGSGVFIQAGAPNGSYRVPSDGVITSWSFQAPANPRRP